MVSAQAGDKVADSEQAEVVPDLSRLVQANTAATREEAEPIPDMVGAAILTRGTLTKIDKTETDRKSKNHGHSSITSLRVDRRLAQVLPAASTLDEVLEATSATSLHPATLPLNMTAKSRGQHRNPLEMKELSNELEVEIGTVVIVAVTEKTPTIMATQVILTVNAITNIELQENLAREVPLVGTIKASQSVPAETLAEDAPKVTSTT